MVDAVQSVGTADPAIALLVVFAAIAASITLRIAAATGTLPKALSITGQNSRTIAHVATTGPIWRWCGPTVIIRGMKNLGPTPMKIGNRPKRTTGELIALINQRRADWWPAEFRLTIDRSAEHDWIAFVDARADDLNGNRGADFSNSLAQVVAELRLRNAWAGH